MTAHFAREQAVFLPSDDHLARHAGVAARPAHQRGRFARLVRSALARLREASQRRAVLHELNALSERELADMGLTRDELHRVFDPAFAPDRRGA